MRMVRQWIVFAGWGMVLAACAGASGEQIGVPWRPAAPTWSGALTVRPLDPERVELRWPTARDEATPLEELRYRWRLEGKSGAVLADEARGVTAVTVGGLVDDRHWRALVVPRDSDGLDGEPLGPLSFELPTPGQIEASIALTDVALAVTGDVLTVDWRLIGAAMAARCALGERRVEPCGAPWTVSGLAEGPHLLVLTPLDAGGRAGLPWYGLVVVDEPAGGSLGSGSSSSGSSGSGSLGSGSSGGPADDGIPPRLTVTALPASPSWTPWPAVDWQVDDPAAVSECRDDGAEWAPCEPPKVLDGRPGFRAFEIRARDVFGNSSAVETITWIQADCEVPGAWCTEAGRDASPFRLDDGAAADVVLQWPAGVAATADGRVAVADAWGGRIWLFSPDGMARRIAGDGRTTVFDPDGADARRRAIGVPWGIVLEARRVIFSDTRFHCLRAVDLETGALTTIAGACGSPGFADGAAASARFNGPRGLARADDGTLYVADANNHRIRRLRSGVVASIAGDGLDGYAGDGGAATLARLSMPMDVAIGPGGRSLYLADYNNHRVRQIDFALSPAVIRTVIGNGSETTADGVMATATGLPRPLWVAFPEGGELHAGGGAGSGDLVSLTADGRLRLRLPAGASDGNAGNGGPLAAARLRPHLAATALGGDLVVAGRRGLRIVHGDRIFAFGGPADDQAPAVVGAPAVTTTLVAPEAVVVAADGRRWILDRGPGRIYRLEAGRIVAVLGPALIDARAMVLDEDRDRLLVAESGRARVLAVSLADGATTVVAGTGVAGTSDLAGEANALPLHSPWGLRRDGRDLWVVDRGAHCVRRVDLEVGTVATYAGACGIAGDLDAADPRAARLREPTSITGDGAGTLWLFDVGNRRIRRLGANGTATVVGNGGEGSPQAGPGTSSPLRSGRGLVWDAVGRRVMFGQTGGLWGLDVDSGQIALEAGGAEDARGFHGGSGRAADARMIATGELSALGDGRLAVPEPHAGRVFGWVPD